MTLVKGQWEVLGGGIIDGKYAGEQFGSSVSFSSNGTVFVAGTLGSGNVRVYKLDPTFSFWTQLGKDIKRKEPHDKAGSAVSVSDNGTVVAIGTPKNDENGANSGHVRVYQFIGDEWIQLGENIVGEAAGDE